jgi:thiamine-monophosphate kinase
MPKGSEFQRIQALLPPGSWCTDGKGPGDDGFLFDGGNLQWATAVDASVEGIHYRLDWTTPASALRKCLLSNLSDLEAMGAEPVWALLVLGWPRSWGQDVLESLAGEISHWKKEFGITLVGGDTVSTSASSSTSALTSAGSFFSITVGGTVSGKALLRSAARPGQSLYVSGPLGSSAAGLHALQTFGGQTIPSTWKPFVRRHHEPIPDLGLGAYLGKMPGLVAAIDISDGLSSEAHHLASMSGCRLVIEWGKLPYDSELKALASPEQIRRWVLHGGEEYRLLFAAEFDPQTLQTLPRPWGIREVGRVELGVGVFLQEPDGTLVSLEDEGWKH